MCNKGRAPRGCRGVQVIIKVEDLRGKSAIEKNQFKHQYTCHCCFESKALCTSSGHPTRQRQVQNISKDKTKRKNQYIMTEK